MLRLAVLALGMLLALLALTPEGVGSASRHAAPPGDRARIIVRPAPGTDAESLVRSAGGATIRRLDHVGVLVADLPVAHLDTLRSAAGLTSVSLDRPIAAALDRAAATVGARWVQQHLGFDGTGIGVALIDSGVARSHPALDPERVVHFVDFVAFRTEPYDGYGHGTHVAGIIAANGSGATRGIAPGADLVVLKTLDHEGHGYVSDAIAAIDYAIAQRTVFNIRVINLSFAAGVYESYRTDPLALAAARAVDAGLIVVTAAGNLGRSPSGDVQYGGVTAPGNAPWVLTVGAASQPGAADPFGEAVAAFSSLGPSAIDFVAKPDLVAPGADIVSLADPEGTLFLTRPASRQWGATGSTDRPYLSLSGTSMAAPVVAGAVAVMLQVNPALSPDGVKALLRATADPLHGYSRLAQGAGRLNLRAAVAAAAHADLVAPWAVHPEGGTQP